MTPANGLVCRGVTRNFGVGHFGVRDVNFRVPYGSVYALVGGNGAGKTTILNLCLGFLTPDSGDIFLDGVPIGADWLKVRLRLAYVPEVARLYAHQSAMQNIRFFDSLAGRDHSDEEILDLLASLDFPRLAAKELASTYSKGMRQKVAIAIGLLKGSDVFLLDEPTSGLDPLSRAHFGEIVKRLRAEGKAIFNHCTESAAMCDALVRPSVFFLACALLATIALGQVHTDVSEGQLRLDLQRADLNERIANQTLCQITPPNHGDFGPFSRRRKSATAGPLNRTPVVTGSRRPPRGN